MFTLYQSRDSGAEIEDEARHDVRLMMTSVQASASYYLRQNDLAALQAVLESQEDQEQVKFLAVVDPAGTILAGTPRFSKGGSLLSVRPDAADILALCSRSPLAGAIRLDTRYNLLFGCYPANPSSAAGSFDSRNGYLIVSYDFSHRKLLGEQRLIRLTLLVWSLFGAGFLLLMALLRHALARRRIAFLLSARQLRAGASRRAGFRYRDRRSTRIFSTAADRNLPA